MADDRLKQTADQVSWNLEVGSEPAGGFGWILWTDDSLWLPLPVTGRAASEEDANAVARKVATRCTDTVGVYMQETGIWDVKFAQMNAFPGTPAGGGSAVGRMSLMGDEPEEEQDRWSDLEARAVDWQTRGGRQTFVALDSGEEASGERLRELFGCMGALGEQATLACAAARDLAVRRGRRRFPRPAPR